MRIILSCDMALLLALGSRGHTTPDAAGRFPSKAAVFRSLGFLGRYRGRGAGSQRAFGTASGRVAFCLRPFQREADKVRSQPQRRQRGL
jgi:hypothetical protein